MYSPYERVRGSLGSEPIWSELFDAQLQHQTSRYIDIGSGQHDRWDASYIDRSLRRHLASASTGYRLRLRGWSWLFFASLLVYFLFIFFSKKKSNPRLRKLATMSMCPRSIFRICLAHINTYFFIFRYFLGKLESSAECLLL